MRRKSGIIILIFSILALVCLFFVYPLIIKQNKRFNDCIINYKEFEKLKKERIETNQFNPSIEFNEQSLFREADTNFFYYSLVEGSSTARNPRINLNIETKEPLKIAFCNNKITDILLEKDIHIRFIIYSDEYFQEFYLVCTTLPIMNINCEGDIGDADVNMTLYLFDNQKDCTKRITKSEGKIRVRGRYTRTYIKKGFKITTTEKSLGNNTRFIKRALLGMKQDDEWVLDAGYSDYEKIRNIFSQKLWKISCAKDNKDKIDTGIEYKYLELFINEKYWGLYAIGYQVNEQQLGMSGNINNDALYKTTGDWFSQQQISNDNFELKHKMLSSDEQDGNDLGLIFEYYQNYNNIKNNNYELKKRIDLDNAIDIFLFNSMTQGVSNANGFSLHNMYIALYTKNNVVTSLYIPWDLDQTWGNIWNADKTNQMHSYGVAVDENINMKNIYLEQLIINEDYETKKKIIDKYFQLRQEVWSKKNIDTLIDKYEKDIYDSGAFLREIKRWPDGSYLDSNQKLSAFKSYVHKRLQAMDDYINRLKSNIDSSIFVWRCQQYKNFYNSNFCIVINDKTLINDGDYKDLFDYLHIDISKIKTSTKYIVGSVEQGYQYMEEYKMDDTYVNQGIELYFSNEESTQSFDFSRDFVFQRVE